ncbi:MAG: XdhC family protein [Bacteroidota bacterium]|nr:XdhC family protein [Bacteroidota bacterium]
MKIWNFIYHHLSNNKNVVLITVVERNGSSPGVVGFKMAISASGEMEGSIGGGIMEYKMSKLAKSIAMEGNKNPLIKKQIHNPDAGEEKSGLICSGEQTHAFIPLNSSHLNEIKKIVDVLARGDNGVLNLTNKGLFLNKNMKSDEPIQYIFKNDDDWEYKEKIGLKDTIFIFGAGHISVPLSQVCRMLDFRVVVLDDRKNLSTFENNQFAHQKHIINFNNIADMVPDNPHNSYVVIMSFAHKNDEVILKQMVNKNLKYLGMIGSKNKIKTIYDSLTQQGISEKDLSRVDAPIGLSINSKTTAEIAISIAAKIIQVRNS